MFYMVSKPSSEPESTFLQRGSPVRNSINSSFPFGFVCKILENPFPYELPCPSGGVYTLRRTKRLSKAHLASGPMSSSEDSASTEIKPVALQVP